MRGGLEYFQLLENFDSKARTSQKKTSKLTSGEGQKALGVTKMTFDISSVCFGLKREL